MAARTSSRSCSAALRNATVRSRARRAPILLRTSSARKGRSRHLLTGDVTVNSSASNRVCVSSRPDTTRPSHSNCGRRSVESRFTASRFPSSERTREARIVCLLRVERLDEPLELHDPVIAAIQGIGVPVGPRGRRTDNSVLRICTRVLVFSIGDLLCWLGPFHQRMTSEYTAPSRPLDSLARPAAPDSRNSYSRDHHGRRADDRRCLCPLRLVRRSNCINSLVSGDRPRDRRRLGKERETLQIQFRFRQLGMCGSGRRALRTLPAPIRRCSGRPSRWRRDSF